MKGSWSVCNIQTNYVWEHYTYTQNNKVQLIDYEYVWSFNVQKKKSFMVLETDKGSYLTEVFVQTLFNKEA